jgi:hypothetical protein
MKLRGASLALLLAVVVAGCRTAPPLPPADFSAPGWRVQQGQAVWKPSSSRTELAGDLLLATNANGNFFVQFSKMPFPLATAQISGDQWQIEFGADKYSWQGRGTPPDRFAWFQLPHALLGQNMNGNWQFKSLTTNSWRLENSAHRRKFGGRIFPMKWFRWWWLLLLIPIIVGLARLHFDVEVLDLLPANVPAVQGLKLYQQHFANARELIVTVKAPDREAAEQAAKSIAENLQRATNLVADATWQPPWLEHPDQTAELIAYLWLNQPPEKFSNLAAQLSETNLANVLAATRDQLATTLSPNEIAQLSYDPFGLTRLPENVAGTVSGFGSGQQLFASADGTFRIIFVKARGELNGYRECTDWFNAVKQTVSTALPPSMKKNRLHRPARVRRGNFRQHETRHHPVRRRHVGHHRDFILARASPHQADALAADVAGVDSGRDARARRADFRRDQRHQHGLRSDSARPRGGLRRRALSGGTRASGACPFPKSAAPSRPRFFGRRSPPFPRSSF